MKQAWPEPDVERFNKKILQIIEAAGDDGTADCTGVVFLGLDLQGRKLGRLLAREATFCGRADFRKATFGGLAYFTRATFSGGVDFREATFTDADFTRATFSENADFREATFSGGVAFSEATFTDAIFNEATFSGSVDFSEVTFSGHAIFTRATLSGGTHFTRATFSGFAVFGEATFSGYTAFSEATFNDGADFHEATFTLGADFSEATFTEANFREATFSKTSQFSNARFKRGTSFRGCDFHEAPSFHEATLHQDTDFDAKFPDKFPDSKAAAEAARAYRTLKLAMENVRARQEEARFYALEQKALNAQAGTPAWAKLASWMYETTSDYGQSALRPIVCLVSLMIGASLLYWLVYLLGADFQTEEIISGMIEDLGSSLKLAMRQNLRPFSLWTPQGEAAALKEFGSVGLVAIVQLVGLVQSLLSYVFLGLFALALRWRFRRG